MNILESILGTDATDVDGEENGGDNVDSEQEVFKNQLDMSIMPI